MQFRVRSYLMAGVGIVAAGAIAIPPSVAPPTAAPRHESVTLTAHAQPMNPFLQRQVPELDTAQAAAELLPAAAFSSTEALTETLDTASAQVSALALPGLESAIIGAYNAIIPWVDWGVNLGIYATQWIPIVNWFTPQISIFYYSLIRPIITSAVYNIAFWVGGSVSFLQGLSNFFNDTVNAGIGFVNAEIDWVLSFLPPLPPFPPFFSSVAAESVMEVVGARTAMQIEATAGEDLPEGAVTGEDGTTTLPVDPGEETPPPPIETEPVIPEPTTPALPQVEKDLEEPEAPVETPETPVKMPEAPEDSLEAELEDEIEAPAPDLELNNDELNNDELNNDELNNDELKDGEKPETDPGAGTDKEAEKEADPKKPEPEKADTEPENKAESGPDA